MSNKDQDNDPFGAINFGEFRKYMQNKKSKLKMQEKEVQDQSSQELVPIFSGTSIYINGYTNPPNNELRRMILQHGGDYQHYLKKSSVTHIIATNLTNSKLEEFRTYKVVNPEWITESVNARKLLPWQNYRLASTCSKQKELVVSRSTVPDSSKPTGESLNAQILATERAKEMSTANPEFLDRFYKSSRLHYLSTWKSELKDIVEKLEESGVKKINADGKKRKRVIPRIVMHVDFDCFFASVGMKDKPHLVDKPVAVSHSMNPNESSSSDIASCNYIARSFGLRNGMAIGRAKGLCPELQVIPYEFDKYKEVSIKFYEILFQYADTMQAISVDEALLEVGSSIETNGVEALATEIRHEIKRSTGCDASIGIGPNILLARMSTRKAKPAGQYYCKSQDDIDSLLGSQSVTQLPGVGYAIGERLRDMSVDSVSDLKEIPLHELQSKFGSKMGKTLYEFSRGIDHQPLITHQKRASVSAEVNWGVRFVNEENEREFLSNLSKEVSSRLQKYNVKGKSITLKFLKRKEDAVEASKHLGHGIVDSYSKSVVLPDFTDDSLIINKHAYSLLKSFNASYADIRGLGIHVSKLNNQDDLPADQSKLNFSNTNNMATTTETTEPMKKTTDAASTKRDLEVDYEIFKELPDSVQKELASEYELVFQDTATNSEQVEKNCVEIDTNAPFSSQLPPELPPWSQLDPSALLALPDTMREQVLKAYEGKNLSKKQEVPNENATTPKAPTHYLPPSTSGRKTPRSRKNATTPSITRMLKKTKSPSVHASGGSPGYKNTRFKSLFNQNEPLPFDEEVWNELPEFVQIELLDEHRKAKNNQELQQIQREHMMNRESSNKIDLNYIEEPSLEGTTDINELRRLLKSFIVSFDVESDEKDTSTVISYLVELVQQSQTEKVRLLLAYLEYTTAQLCETSEQRKTVMLIKKSVDEAMIRMYGCTLNIG